MNSIIAARMAEKGFNGPSDIFESKDGLLHAYSFHDHYDAKYITEGLGEDWTFTKSFHQGVSVLPLFRRPPGRLPGDCEKYHPNAEDIEKIEIRSSKYTMHLLAEPCKWAPRNIVDLQFSMPYQAAIAFKNGKFTWMS